MDPAWLWEGEGPGARLARGLLRPASWVYGMAAAVRNGMYDRGRLAIVRAPIPVISIGNHSVGGTGKTPFTAFVVGELARRGVPAGVVLRGYGGDEVDVHRELNPGAPVVMGADRVAGVTEAARQGARVAVLDDAFQHRRLHRDADVVLVDAERWREDARCLPAGPLREHVVGLRRATLVLVTRKLAGEARAQEVRRDLLRLGARDVGSLALRPAGLRQLGALGGGAGAEVSTLAGRRVLVVSGIGNPAAFEGQVAQLGASIRVARYPDHHRYTPGDVRALLHQADGCEWVVSTLKDVVKLRTLWPREGQPLWYVSQRIELADDARAMVALLDRLAGPAAGT